MKLKKVWIKGFKNLTGADGWFKLDFTDKDGITVLIGNNGSGKSNVLEAISAIFTGLFKMGTPQRKPKFEYEIEYVLNENDTYKLSLNKHGDEYRYNFHKDDTHIPTTTFKSNPSLYLPSSIIAIYSGEEVCLWENYYKHLYNDFMKDVRRELQFLPTPSLFYINKFYWNIALLTLLYSSLDDNIAFCKRILKIDDLDSINVDMKFNSDNIVNFETNTITDFINTFSNGNTEKSFTVAGIKELAFIGTEKEFFIKLMASIMNKESKYKLIDSLAITFGEHNLNIDALSEGEKKQILIRIALEVVADENSLVLFDEPDANIHVANKEKIKIMLDEYNNRENVLTTHSPTLMHKFEDHLVYLESGEVKGHEKAEILKELSGDFMSFSEQQIVLNSNHDILIVEGKSDIVFIKEAISKLTGYSELKNIIFIPTGGASGLKLFIDKFTANDNQKIIALLDNDKAGKDEVKEILTDAYQMQLSKNGYVKMEEFKNTFLLILPKPVTVTNSQYEIEDYFPLEKLIMISKTQIDTFKVLKDFSIKKDMVKKKLSEQCSEYAPGDFENFKQLFDLIKVIKDTT